MNCVKEIGSEFWDIPLTEKKNNLFPKSTQWFLSGRIALNYILLDIKKHSLVNNVWVPSWCCDSMIKPFYDNGFNVEFYPVYFDGYRLVQEFPENAEIILVLDYFGFCSDNDFTEYEGIVIRDLTHTIFCKKYNDADYYFGSLRKWCGIWTGGFAWGKSLIGLNSNVPIINNKYIELRKESMEKKKKYINGDVKEKDFLNSFSQAEEILDNLSDIEYGCDRDIQLIDYIDADLIRKKRRKNAETLLDEIGEIAIFNNLNKNDSPLFVPIFVANREILRKELIKNRIYCPVHWPISNLHRLNGKETGLYEKELSLICDQRYSVQDMKKISEIVKKGVT